jgi:hypothetical protein
MSNKQCTTILDYLSAYILKVDDGSGDSFKNMSYWLHSHTADHLRILHCIQMMWNLKS